MVPFVNEELQEKLDAVPGIDVNTIQNVIAEIGTDMNQFPSHAHLRSWTGICPVMRNRPASESGARRPKGIAGFRPALTQAAWAATHTKDSYLGAEYHRLAGRRGKKRALVAVAHTLLVIIYHIIKYRVDYRDLGADYFLRLEPDRQKRYLVKRLEQLGYEVQLAEKHAA